MTIASNESTAELYKQLALQAGISIHRLRVIKGSDGSFIPSSIGILVDSTGLRQQSTIYVKDLGMSLRLRRVPLVERTVLFSFPATILLTSVTPQDLK